MNKSKAKKFKKKLLSIESYYLAGIALAVSLLFKGGLFLSPAVAISAYFSWEIFRDDIKEYKVSHFSLTGLLVGGIGMAVAGAHFDVSILRGVIFFFIGWGMFQLFEGDIGGGDVRLLTVVALFLNVVQLLAAISLASAVGMLVAWQFKIKRVPFGSLLIVAFWLSFWIVRF
ncbi:MAG: hypothetical protein H6799_01200 [Candidatus Nomurabacteria bacterium]|mgnify:CR=1 FL=1|nr:MAG: hypothetical protein H6799_01200 [Candidatus Nomurabacteria bacterium]HRV76344.1 hypothetical protein [Candidatus Saccharimonadales bacterium]